MKWFKKKEVVFERSAPIGVHTDTHVIYDAINGNITITHVHTKTSWRVKMDRIDYVP